MSFKSMNQKGFAAIEAVLVIVILAIVGGTGYYIYQANNKAIDTQNAAQTNANTATPPKKNYLTIKEWDVRLPYNGQDTYTYKFDEGSDLSVVTIVSSDLAKKYDCTDMGAGQIRRLLPSDDPYPAGGSGTTVKQDAAKNPQNYTHVGDYYYAFMHDSAACSQTVIVSAQNQANNDVAAIVKKLQPIQ